MIALDPKVSALVVIDLQKGIMEMPLVPRGSAEIVAGTKKLAARFRDGGSKVVWVRVGFSEDGNDRPPQAVDSPMPGGARPPGWSDLVEGLAQPGDLHILKRQWGAFYGTDLDLQLRRRGVRALVLSGVATNFGVESTARQAWEYGYEVVLAEDLTATRSPELHTFALQNIFPRISRVAQSDALAFAR